MKKIIIVSALAISLANPSQSNCSVKSTAQRVIEKTAILYTASRNFAQTSLELMKNPYVCSIATLATITTYINARDKRYKNQTKHYYHQSDLEKHPYLYSSGAFANTITDTSVIKLFTSKYAIPSFKIIKEFALDNAYSTK